MSKINNNLGENKKPKLLNTYQNKRLLSFKIEEYFSKSNLKSLELSYENKNSTMKQLLFKFHILYNSLIHIKSSSNKDNTNIKKYLIPNKDKKSSQSLFLISKKKLSTNQINNIKNKVIKTQEKYQKNKKALKPIKSFTYLKNDILLNNRVLKTERSLNTLDDNSKYQQTNENKNKNYNFNSQNKLKKIMFDSNIVIKPKNSFNEKKIKFNKYKKIIKSTIIMDKNKDNNNKILFSADNSVHNIKINKSTNLIQLKRNENNNKTRLKEKYMNTNFKSLNQISININLENQNDKSLYNNNIYKVKKNLNLSKEETTHKISKNYKFKQRYTFQNENDNLNKIYIINNIYTKESSTDFSRDNKTNCKEKNNKNLFLWFFTDKKNYKILTKIYDFLYINEKIKDKNKFKNIIGPFREIYLNKCLVEIKNQLEKFELKKKNDDVWNIMEKEVLLHKMNKINGFIQDNNKEIIY